MRVEQKEVDIDVSVASTTTPWMSLEHIYGFSVIVNALAAQVGSLQLQVSNDAPNTISGNAGTVVPFALGSAFVINGAAVQALNQDACHYRWVRAVYTKTSGTGTLQMLFNFKGN